MKRETKVQYSLSFSKKRRTILIKMSDAGEVKVLAPSGTSRRKVEEVLLLHSSWIEKRKDSLEKLDQPLPKHTYKNGDSFLLDGELISLVVIKGSTNNITKKDSSLFVTSKSISVSSIKRIVEEYYDAYGLELYTRLVSHWITQLGLEKTPYTISMVAYPKRLGSCSSQNHLSFSRRSLMMPVELLDYLALHEVAHLIYFNHSASFKTLLQDYMSDYKERYNKIKQLRLRISHL